jgi:hypothetical protein
MNPQTFTLTKSNAPTVAQYAELVCVSPQAFLNRFLAEFLVARFCRSAGPRCRILYAGIRAGKAPAWCRRIRPHNTAIADDSGLNRTFVPMFPKDGRRELRWLTGPFRPSAVCNSPATPKRPLACRVG